MAVDTTPIQAIYDRLNQVSAFHPGTTEIFDDFLQEAGDVISLVSGSETFNFPVFAQHMKWTGSMLTSMESTGNETRNELPPLQRRAKNRSYGAGRRMTEQEEQLTGYKTELIRTEKYIGMEAKAIGVKVDPVTGEPLVDPNDPNEFQWDDTSSTKIFSRLILSPNRAQLISAINNDASTTNIIKGALVDLSAQGTVLIQAINRQDPTQTSITLDAAQINLTGYVKATEISAEIAAIDALTSSTGYIGNIKASAINASGNITAAGAVIGSGLYIGTAAPYTSVSDAVKSIIVDPAPPAGKIGFKFNTLGDATYQAINFNIADTAKYQADVGIASLASDGASFDPSDYNDWDCPVLGSLNYGGYYLVKATPNAGSPMYVKFAVPADRYNSGWAAAEGKVVWPGTNTTAGFLIKAPSSTVGGETSKSFVVDQTGDTVYVYMGGTTVATLPVTGGGSTYADGWNDLVEAADTSSYVQYSGASSVSSSLTKSNGTIDGYIWLKDYSGTWQRRRHLTVSYPNDSYNKSVTLTYKGSVSGVYTYTTSTYVSGLTTNARYTVHFNA